jgi:hypothetical protein
MTDINIHPLVRRSYEVSLAIEECDAGEKQTNASILSSQLTRDLAAYFEWEKKRQEVGQDDYVGYMRWAGYTPNRYLQVCDSDSPGAFKVYRL